MTALIGGFAFGGAMTALHKSFGSFEIKAVDEEKRTFTGVASTPNQDRSKDIMIPKGAKFQLPMPLLFHHDMRQPIGHVTDAKVTSKGIEVELHIPEIKEAGRLKDRVDEAYQSLKYDLVKGLSVGFLPNWDKAEMIKGGGIQFDEWEWYELSLVTILITVIAEQILEKHLRNTKPRWANNLRTFQMAIHLSKNT